MTTTKGLDSSIWHLTFKYYLYTFNIISLILGITLLTLTLWIRFDWDFKHWVHELEMYQYWTADYILMFSSTVVILLSAAGCCAAIYENPGLLLVHSILNGLLIILEVSGLAHMLNNGIMYSEITDWLEERFFQLLFEADYNPRAARILRIIQENVGCCGSDDWVDYPNHNKAVPDDCRDPETGNLWDLGCAESFSRFLEPRTGWTSGLTLFLVVLQILAIISSLSLRHHVRKRVLQGKSYTAVHKV